MKNGVLLCALLLFVPSVSTASAANLRTTRENASVVRGLPIACSGVDYVWSGMTRGEAGKHVVEILKEKNSSPLRIQLLERDDVLMVDNQPYTIVRTNEKETFAVYIDELNLITVVLNYRYGTVLYNKTFTNVDVGKQNAMSFVATCEND